MRCDFTLILALSSALPSIGSTAEAWSAAQPGQPQAGTLEVPSGPILQNADKQHVLTQTEQQAKLGIRCFLSGEYARAESLLSQSLQTFKELLGEEHPAYATNLNALGCVYTCLGRYTQAEPLLRQALHIRKRVLGEDHLDYLDTLNNLAGLYMKTGDYQRARPLLHQLVEAHRKVVGEEHPLYGGSLNNLGLLYLRSRDYERA